MKLYEIGRGMDTDYLYKWVTIQLDSGIPKEEIIKNIVNYANLSQEEAKNYVNDPLYRGNFGLPDNEEQVTEQEPTDENIVSKLSGIENQLKEINKHIDFTFLSLIYIGFGVLIGWLIWG